MVSQALIIIFAFLMAVAAGSRLDLQRLGPKLLMLEPLSQTFPAGLLLAEDPQDLFNHQSLGRVLSHDS